MSDTVNKIESKKKVSIGSKIKSMASKLKSSLSSKKSDSTSKTSSTKSSDGTKDKGGTDSSGGSREDSVKLSDKASEIAEQERPKTEDEDQVNQNQETEQGQETNENQEAEKTGTPDFNKMTPQEQYDYLKNTVVQQAGGDESAWKTGEGEVNLIGIRSWENGQPGSRDGNKYNDTIYAARMENGEPKIDAFTASTDGGIWSESAAKGRGFGVSSNGEWQGISHLADGHYQDSWIKGKVPLSDLGLRQSGNIRVHADGNSDGVIQNNERLGSDINGDGIGDGEVKDASWGIQFHPGGTGENVGQYSAGCQVIKAGEYDRFKSIISNATNSKFSYTLIDSSNLPKVDAQHAYDGTVPTASVPEAPVGGGTSVPAGTTTVPQGTASTITPTNYQNFPQAQVPATHSVDNAYGPAAGYVDNNSMMYPGLGMMGMGDMMGMMGMGEMDQQIAMMCMMAQQEMEQGVKNGPAVQSLAQWYQMSGQGNMPVSSETKKMVSDILQQAGVDLSSLKAGNSNTSGQGNAYMGGYGGMWGASPLQFYQ